MRTRIIALIIVAIMIFPTSFAALAANEVEVTKVMFTDADKSTEIASLYDFTIGVGCSFSYKASEAGSAYGMLLLRKNGKIISCVEQEFALELSGIATFDGILEPDMSEAGVYEASFMLFDSRENMKLIKGSDVKISGEVYPADFDATYGLGLGYETGTAQSKMSYYRASGTADNGSMSISTDNARNGNASLMLPMYKSWDRVFTISSLSTGAIKNKLLTLGNGKYRVCGYIYPASEELVFSPRLVVKNSNVNSGKEYNYTSKFTAQPGKWTYFYADYDVEDYFSSGLSTARPQIQIEKTMASEQYVYIDDLKLIKLEEGLEEMNQSVDVVVKAQAKANENVIVTAEGVDSIYGIESVTADDDGVVEARLSLSDGYDPDEITINVYAGNTASTKMTDGLNIDDVTYVDFRYFALGDINGVKINSIIVDGNLMPYDEIVLGEGDVGVSFDISNPDEKSLRIVAAKYNNGIFRQSVISAEDESDILIEGISAGDTLEMFLVDDKMTLTSHLYTLSAHGLTETEIYETFSEFDSLPVANYNTVSAGIEFDVEADKESFIIVAAYPSDKAEDEDFAYLGVKKLEKGDNHITALIDKSRYESSRLFKLDYYTISPDVSGSLAPFDYVGEKELLGYYEVLNNPDSGTSEIYNAISAKALKIDMGFYNSLSSSPKAQTKALELFSQYNDKKDIADAADIQKIFERALATVILSCSPTSDAIEQLGDKIPLNEEYFADFMKEEAGFKDKVAELITDNAASPEDARNEKANALFEDAYLTAQLTYNAETYGAFMQMITETYEEIIKLDLSEIGSLNESDVFKYMFKNRSDISNTADVESLYEEAIATLSEEKKDNDKPSRGGSGGGGGGGKYVAPVEKEPAPAPERTKFTDMNDSHWAIESVLFLNGIGVVSDAASYRPDDMITREEAVKMLVCSFGDLDTSAQCSFGDVDSTSWCYPYIASAYKTGMVNGVDEKTFGVGRSLSRQDALVMIYRIIKDSLDALDEDSVLEFSDKDSISDYAAEAVGALCSNGIVNGYADGTFRPDVPISRAEFAKLLTTVFRR